MKIIGITGPQYLVEMSAVELKRLTGHGRAWGDAASSDIGAVLEIVKPWDTICSLQSHQGNLPAMANKLRALADLLEPIAVEIPVVQDAAK